MGKSEKNQTWVLSSEIDKTPIIAGGAPLAGVERQIMAYCDECMCAVVEAESGAVVGLLHSHPNTQITFISEGLFEYTVAGETRILKKGDTALTLANVEHGCVCVQAGTMVEFFVPMRPEFV